MRTNRKRNRYAFLTLGIIHTLLLIFTLYKSKDRKKHIVLFVNYAGFAYIFEYIIVALLNGYVYKPKFLKQKMLDKMFGAVWSQLFYVPVTALFITVFKFGWKVKFLFSVYFILIEKLFIFLGAYKNNWWRTRYTFVMILLSFFINDKWNDLLSKRNPFILFVSFFNFIQVTWMNMIYLLGVLKKIKYGFPPYLSWKDHFKVAPAVGYLVSLLSAWKIKEGSFASKCQLLMLMWAIDTTLLKKRMLKIKMMPLLLAIYSIIFGTTELYKKLVFGQGYGQGDGSRGFFRKAPTSFPLEQKEKESL